MMRSLYSGVAGLKTHQTKMDVIGNNIANVNTTSFKSQSITFSDLMYQTTQTASGATETKGGVNARQIGLGAKSGAINTAIESQGATQTTNNPFDIMITGKAFFVVNDGSKQMYTRDGSFYVDGAGNLAMQSNGYLVQGWEAVEDRETGAITINRNGELTGLQIMSPENSTYSPASTTAALYSGNIDDNDTNVTSDDGKTITLEFYDNKGYLYTGKFTLKDTGTDHLFALTLEDIIDSNGTTIGSDLLKQITLGDTTSETRTDNITAKSGYTFVVDETATPPTIDVNADAGDVKYQKVPLTGNLSDLMNSSKAYKNVLFNAYPITETAAAEFSNKATYSINKDTGAITITDTKTPVNDEYYASAKFTFENVSGSYYINSETNESYIVPQANSGTDSSIFSEDYLKDVFGITNNTADLIAPNAYSYSFDVNTETITFKKALELDKTSAPATNMQNYSQSTLVGTYNEAAYFFDSNGQALTTAVNNWASSGTADDPHDIDKIVYSYVGNPKTLTLNYYKLEDDNGNAGVAWNPEVSLDQISAFTTEAGSGALTLADLAALKSNANADVSAAAAEIEAKVLAKLSDLETQSDPVGQYISSRSDEVSVTVRNITGDGGITINYPTKKESTTPTVIGTFTQETAATGSLQTPYERKAPLYSYTNKNNTTTKIYNKGYAFESNTGTFTGPNTDPYTKFLSEVFENKDQVTSFLENIGAENYKLTINPNDGTIDIEYKKVENATNLISGYSVKDNGDDTVNFTSLEAYGDVPSKGNIADLLTSAKTTYSGLLEKIYGISDEQADAYGTDGTYEIVTDAGSDQGTIKLTTGDHTIQLKFNAANGALVSADGNTSGMVTMNFNQTIPGLEAFGFQASPSNPDEVEKKGDVYIDFATVTNYNTNGSSTIKAVKGDKKSLNTGRAVGEMNGVSVSTDGQIYATYSNGQTKLLGQIASAEFANASGLSKEGDNLYTQTLNSGEATIQDITTDGGYMNTGVLEMSNVDLSSQFTEMITTQRGFQANSRIITVSDTLLEELTNLKR